MSRRTVFTTISPLPAGVSREVVLDTLHDHLAMIDLNPAHDTRTRMEKPPSEASPEEYHTTTWYEITDKISYFPGYKFKVSFKACFHDLSNGLQTHCYAPMGLDLKEKWTLCGNLPHEPAQPAEIGIGAPITGLYLREDVEMRCNFLMTRFVRKTLKDSLAALVARLLVKSQIQEAAAVNRRLTHNSSGHASFQTFPPPGSPHLTAPELDAGMGTAAPPYGQDPPTVGLVGDRKSSGYIVGGYYNQMPGMASFPPRTPMSQGQYFPQQQFQPYNPSYYHQPAVGQGHMRAGDMYNPQKGGRGSSPQQYVAELPP